MIKTIYRFIIDAITVIILLYVISINSYIKEINSIINNKGSTCVLQPEFLKSTNPKEDLLEVLHYYDIKHPEIVYAQAILETGHFNSRVCKEYNNLFGLYNSRTKDYYKFNHWSESVVAYINYIQYKYVPPNDYYEFLINIGYAEDPLYVTKLKKIVKNNF